MRIKVNFNLENKILPINNQHLVNSYIHKVLGKNNVYHDSVNDYSISSIQGGKLSDNQLHFNGDGYITISSNNMKFINDMMLNLYTNKLNGDISVKSIEFIEEKFYDGWNHFASLSPFIIKEYSDKKTYKFLTLHDDTFENKVKIYLKNKLSKIDSTLDLTNFDIKIPENNKHKIKKIMVKNVTNFANQCQLSIYCNSKVANILYNIGIGQSTGCGFGTIYKTENHNIYK